MNSKIYNTFTYLFFFVIISFYIISVQDISRHWTSNFDMELIISYNSILYMSGLNQEYLDHPTSIFFIIHSIFLKFLNLINFFEIKNLNQLNNENNSINEDLNNLIYWTRYFNIFLCTFFAIIFFKILRHKFDYIIALTFTLIFLFSATFLDQASQVRSELLCILFIFIAINFLTKFLENKKRNLNLFLFFIFVYLSVFMKNQIMFYIPLLILIPLYVINLEQKLIYENNRYKFLDKKFFLFSFYIFIILLILIFANKNYATLQSKIFLIGFYLYLNLVFILYLFFLKSNFTRNLFLFNGILLASTSLFFIILLLHPSTNGISQKLFNFMSIKFYSNIPSDVDNITWIFNFLDKFFTLIPVSINSIFFEIKDYTLLIYILIGFTLLNFKRLDKKILFSIFLVILFVLFSKIIINFRYDAIRYDIFFQPFLIYMLVEVLSKIKKKNTIYLLSIIILLSTFSINKDMIFNQQHPKDRINLFCSEVSNGYLDTWHKNLSKNKIKKFCISKEKS